MAHMDECALTDGPGCKGRSGDELESEPGSFSDDCEANDMDEAPDCEASENAAAMSAEVAAVDEGADTLFVRAIKATVDTIVNPALPLAARARPSRRGSGRDAHRKHAGTRRQLRGSQERARKGGPQARAGAPSHAEDAAQARRGARGARGRQNRLLRAIDCYARARLSRQNRDLASIALVISF